MRSTNSFSLVHVTLAAAALLLVASVAFAQVESPGEESMRAALQDLSAVYGSSVVRADQARAICNEEQYMIECANIGKKHGLFPKEREREVDSILSKFKGKLVDELKECASTECLITVATKIARDLSATNPTLARTVGLTVQDVEVKRSIVEVSKSVGVDIDECRVMDPDTASVEFLRACAKLAKDARIQRHIPEEFRSHAEKTEQTAGLKEALARGDLACGDGTLEGCGTFCLNPGATNREAGTSAIPAVCRQIAEQFFGDEGMLELERTYQDVSRTYDDVRTIYTERRGVSDGEFRPFGTTTQHIACPAVKNTPCPAGEYRQGSVNEFGCYGQSACIPLNTETQPERKDTTVICPAMPTVDRCPAGEEKVVSFSSPECGTYYTCRPKPEDRTTKFPYKFASGRVALSFDEARIYCYESGPNGATTRGDKEECLRSFGITVPDISPEKQCVHYGEGWHTMDGSGNCFNPSMTEYRTPGGALQRCSTMPAYGCTKETEPTQPPGGQKEQVWNALGLRSWIRSDASESRIAELKAACSNVPGGANIWLPDAGTYSSKDFGMPDAEKCRKASACTSSQYFNGTECTGTTARECAGGQYWSGTSCVPTTSTSTWSGSCYSYGGNETTCKAANCTWYADHYDGSHCDDGAHGRSSAQTCLAGQYWDGGSCKSREATVSGSCSSDIKSLLGTGCHSMGNAWFNEAMTLYVLPASTVVKSCSSEKFAGCSGSHASVTCPYGQFWNGSSCASSTGTICGQNEYWDAGKGSCMSSARACVEAKGTWDSSRNYCVMPGTSPTPTPSTSPSPSPTSGTTTSCPSGQYWSGTACVTSGTSGSSMQRCFYPNATINGSPPGYTVWCESDYNNCHKGDPSGASVSVTGLSLGAPSSCEYGWSSGSTGMGGGCSMYTSESSCSVMSACQWQGGSCVARSTSGSTGTASSCSSGQYWSGTACVTSTSGSSCASGQYWNGSSCVSSGGTDYSSAQSSCTSAGGSWNSTSYYCTMPNTSSSSSCGSGQYWNGSACVSSSSGMDYSSAQSGCASAGGTWDSTSNYCVMPTSSPTPTPTPSPEPTPSPSPSPTASVYSPIAYLCPSSHAWNGSYCTLAEQKGVSKFLANVIQAFTALFGRR